MRNRTVKASALRRTTTSLAIVGSLSIVASLATPVAIAEDAPNATADSAPAPAPDAQPAPAAAAPENQPAPAPAPANEAPKAAVEDPAQKNIGGVADTSPKPVDAQAITNPGSVAPVNAPESNPLPVDNFQPAEIIEGPLSGNQQAINRMGAVKVEQLQIAQEKWTTLMDKNNNLRQFWAYSPSMNRYVPLAIISPRDGKGGYKADMPIYYLFNGADGGEGRANWLAQTDIMDFFGNNVRRQQEADKPANEKHEVIEDKPVNVVIPMAGQFSYYTDWVEPNTNLDDGGNRQMWETFMTKELPNALKSALHANDKKAVAGMSMSATTSLLYAEHHPGMYDAVGSFSGCAQTANIPGAWWADITLQRGAATRHQIWGADNGPFALWNDALVMAKHLKGQENIYISTGSGLMGEWDVVSSPRNQAAGSPLISAYTVTVEGGAIEAATSACTHNLKAKMDLFGINANWNFRAKGTHSWGYWEEDLHLSWPTIAQGLGVKLRDDYNPHDAGRNYASSQPGGGSGS